MHQVTWQTGSADVTKMKDLERKRLLGSSCELITGALTCRKHWLEGYSRRRHLTQTRAYKKQKKKSGPDPSQERVSVLDTNQLGSMFLPEPDERAELCCHSDVSLMTPVADFHSQNMG